MAMVVRASILIGSKQGLNEILISVFIFPATCYGHCIFFEPALYEKPDLPVGFPWDLNNTSQDILLCHDLGYHKDSMKYKIFWYDIENSKHKTVGVKKTLLINI